METIDPKLFRDLSQDQIEFAGAYLKDIYLNNNYNISGLSDSELKTVHSLIKAASLQATRFKLAQNLAPNMQIQLFKLLAPKDALNMLNLYSNPDVITTVFEFLPKNTQLSLLKRFYKNNDPKYEIIKNSQKGKITRIGGILVHKADIINTHIDSEVTKLLEKITDPAAKHQSLTAYCKTLEKKYDPDGLELLGRELIKGFNALGIKMTSQNAFKQHLKFYCVMELFCINFPDLLPELDSLVWDILKTFKAMEKGEWIVRSFNHFPPYMISRIGEVVLNHQESDDFEKRDLCSKLISKINANMHLKEADRIKAVLQWE
ncbi:hypothetical protein ACFL96_01000 [Thermoproteota archaeon]